MTTIIDEDVAIAEVRKVVEQRGPEFKYRDHFEWCVYAQRPQGSENSAAPACGIGLMLFNLGADPDEMAGWPNMDAVELGGFVLAGGVDGTGFRTVPDERGTSWLNDVGLDATTGGARVMVAFQAVQDRDGATYAEALAAAEREYAWLKLGRRLGAL